MTKNILKTTAYLMILNLLLGQITRAGYKVTSAGHFSIAETQADNWSQGGENTLTWQMDFSSNLKKEHPAWSETHRFEMSYGMSQIGNLPARKSIDEIKVNTVINFNIINRGNPYVAAGILTQITRGYDYPDQGKTAVSDLFDPLYITESAGLERRYNSGFMIRLGLAMKQTLTREFPFPYSDDISTPEVEKQRFEFGLEWVNQYEKSINESTLVTVKTEVFSNLVSIDRTDIRWDGKLSTRISNWLDVSFNLNLIYDKDISNRRQLRQFLAIGFSYAFQ